MASTFAKSTTVSVSRTKVEIEELLAKHGAFQYGIANNEKQGFAICFFSLDNRQVQIKLPLPESKKYNSDQAWAQATRSRWRCLLLILKAKLELIELQLSTVQREFLADVRLPDGRSVSEWLEKDLDAAYLSGNMPPMLGMGSKGR